MKKKFIYFKKTIISFCIIALTACSPAPAQPPENTQTAENDQAQSEQAPPPIEQISSAKTPITDKIKNRNTNLEIALKSINNTIINPNETFSFNATLGERTKEKGYKKAISFDENGKKVKTLGGGICQISTTLYQAALSAGLQINERHSHTKEVPYAKSDADATVAYGGFDLKFTNNKDKPIRISASMDKDFVYIKLIRE